MNPAASPPVLVVGGTSPIGRAVVGAFGGAEIGTLAVGRSTAPSLDVADADQVRAVLESARPETIVYLANPAVVGLDRDSAAHALDALASFAESAVRSGSRRIVFASSAAVYGSDGESPFEEGSPTAPHGAYAQLKLDSENALRSIAERDGIDVVVLRIFNVFGPGLSRSLVNRLFLDEEVPQLWLTDDFVRDYIHVDDVARNVAAAATEETEGFSVVNVGSGRGVSNRRLAELAGVGAYLPAVSPIQPSRVVADVTRARQRWGLRTAISVEDAAEDPQLLLR